MKTLYGKRWYRPMEIAQLGLIQSARGDAGSVHGHYVVILEAIKSGQLKASNYGKTDKPYYLVSETSIREFNAKAHGLVRRP